MTQCQIRSVAESIATREQSCFGMSIFDGKWYVGDSAQLSRIGVTDVEYPAALTAQVDHVIRSPFR
jgi:hypothetical protein